MTTLHEAAERGKVAIAQLRKKQLKQAGTFLLGKEGLPPDLTRMEYADGRIALVRCNPELNTFVVARWLSAGEERLYRKKHQLPRLTPSRTQLEAGIGH